MKHNKLGDRDNYISEVGFGCMSLDKNADDNKSLLLKAYESGINFFDTADLYDQGWNESCVGEALHSVRKEVVIATKVGNQWNDSGTGWNWNPTKSYILKAVEDSLKRLKTDYIDLYQLHGGTIDDPIDETIEAFELLKDQGKIRAYGISSIRPNVIREWATRSNISSVMMQYSLLDRRPEESCLALLEESNISLLARGVFAKGLLINKEPKAYLGYSEADIRELQDYLLNSTSPQAIALQHVLRTKTLGSAVVGIRNEEQLSELIAAASVAVDESLIEKALSVLPALTYQNHR